MNLTKEETQRLHFHGYPSPPKDRVYINNRLIRTFTLCKAMMNSGTLTGDLIKLELAWRNFKRAIWKAFPIVKRIVNYLR